MTSKERIGASVAAIRATREARIHLQHIERDFKDPGPLDFGDLLEQLAAAQSYVQFAIQKLEGLEAWRDNK